MTTARPVPALSFQTASSSGASTNANELGMRPMQERVVEPLALLEEREPKVLLTSYFAFMPWDWPCLTFTDEPRRDTILAESRPGFLAVIYGSASKETPKNQHGKLMGIYQCSHRAGLTDQFLSPAGLQRKRAVAPKDTSWAHAIEAVRAWSIPPDVAPGVADFAPRTYDPKAGTSISRYGRWLAPEEARKILDLDLVPEPTFWGSEVVESALAPAREALKPSRPGPVSQSGYFVTEAEGPKHLYILKLHGNADHFLGRPAGGQLIIKVGFSRSPDSRCRAHNSALPHGAFTWKVLKSSLIEGREPFVPSHAAKYGEQQMIEALVARGHSLGGEFFLASEEVIEDVWKLAITSAEGWNL